MGRETLAAVIPHLKLDGEQIPQQTVQLTELFAAFVADPSDLTGLKVSNIRLIVQSLKMQYERMDTMLARLEQQDE
jgi:hypothetical protein